MNIEEQYKRLDPQPHELSWRVCSKCSTEKPKAHFSLLKHEEGVCRVCSYGPGMERFATIPNMAATIAEVTRFRTVTRTYSTHASRVASFMEDKQ